MWRERVKEAWWWVRQTEGMAQYIYVGVADRVVGEGVAEGATDRITEGVVDRRKPDNRRRGPRHKQVVCMVGDGVAEIRAESAGGEMQLLKGWV